MIGVDANVLLRFLTGNDDAQARSARAFFAGLSPDRPAFVSAVALAETFWVLRRSGRFSSGELRDVLAGMLNAGEFVVDGAEAIEPIVADAASPLLLADLLVAFTSKRAGCSHSVTFDKSAAKSVPGMELLA